MNPDAHFGRERYQLAAIRWIISPEAGRTASNSLASFMDPAYFDTGSKGFDSDLVRKAPAGLTGLIVLGDAWESVDVFHALAVSLNRQGRSKLGYLAELRCKDLVDQGHPSLLPNSPVGPAMAELLSRDVFFIHENDKAGVKADYDAMRKKADAWQTHRTDFMLTRLKQGRHPDTDPAFWQGYVDTYPDPFPESWFRTIYLLPSGIVLLLLLWKYRNSKFGLPCIAR